VRRASEADRDQLRRLRAAADILLVGAGTIRADDPPMRLVDPRLQATRIASNRPAEPRVVIVSGSAALPPNARVLEHPQRPLVAIAAHAAMHRRTALAERAELWCAAGDGTAVDLGALLDMLAAQGVREVLAEGGAQLFSSLLMAQRIDEFALTLSPVLDGGDGPSPLGKWLAPTSALPLELLELHRVGDEIFMRYRICRQRQPCAGAYLP
jgi:riboflavin-specific deaminase-like protein